MTRTGAVLWLLGAGILLGEIVTVTALGMWNRDVSVLVSVVMIAAVVVPEVVGLGLVIRGETR